MDGLSAEQVQKVEQITQAFRQNPDIRKHLDRFQLLLASRGLDKGPPPSMFKMMLILAESEVREVVMDLKTALEEANILLLPSDIQAFMNMYGKSK